MANPPNRILHQIATRHGPVVMGLCTSQKMYTRLAIALANNLAADQMEAMLRTTTQGRILYFFDLIDAFKYMGFSHSSHHDNPESVHEQEKCICGVNIIDVYTIKNIYTDCECNVGCVCQQYWKKVKRDGHTCRFCGTKTDTGSDHVKCTERVAAKRNVACVLDKWKSNLLSRVSKARENLQRKRAIKMQIVRHWTGLARFGRIAIRRKVARFFIKAMDMSHKYAYGTYQTRPISYYRLLKTNPNYCEWICQKSILNRWVKDKIAQIGSAIYD